MNDMNYSEKLKNGTAVGYGIGAIGEGIGYNVFFSFFSFFPDHHSRDPAGSGGGHIYGGRTLGRSD